MPAADAKKLGLIKTTSTEPSKTKPEKKEKVATDKTDKIEKKQTGKENLDSENKKATK